MSTNKPMFGPVVPKIAQSIPMIIVSSFNPNLYLACRQSIETSLDGGSRISGLIANDQIQVCPSWETRKLGRLIEVESLIELRYGLC